MRDIVDEIMDNFDFHKVAKVMKITGWKWAFCKGLKVPTEPEIRHFARNLINSCIREKADNMSSGGFTVRVEDGEVTLLFIIERYTSSKKIKDNKDC